MNNVPQKLRNKWKEEDWRGVHRECMRADEGDCDGRITKEHAIIWQGKQLQEEWAILDICAFHHGVDFHQDGGGMNKEKHVWIALNRATDDELRAISKSVDYIALRTRLNAKYGICYPLLAGIPESTMPIS